MYCILIAGMPATGKSCFARWLSVRRGLPYLSKDAVKERLFDRIGFSSRAEKVALDDAATDILYDFARSQMNCGLPFILENNFEDKSLPQVGALLRPYACTPVTVLFDGDPAAIYERFIARDQSPERHRGHVVNTRYPESGPQSPYVPMGLDSFCAGMESRGFRRFNVGGPRIVVDTSDFSRVDYEAIHAAIDTVLLERR